MTIKTGNVTQQSSSILLGWLTRPWVTTLFLALCSLLVYYPFLNVFFWHDDFIHLKMMQVVPFAEYVRCGLSNPCVDNHWLWNIGVGYVFRPIGHYLVWRFNWQLFQTNPLGYHIFNLSFHIFNTFLIYCIAHLLTGKRTGAFIAALLYTCAFTVMVEPILILHLIHDTLMIFFILLAFYLYIRNQNGTLGYWAGILSVLAYALALLSNEKAIIFPGVLLVYDLLLNPAIPPFYPEKLKRVAHNQVWYWTLSLGLVLLRFRNIFNGLSGDWYSMDVGLWALPKYLWGLRWTLSEYIEPLRLIKHALNPEFNLWVIMFGVGLITLGWFIVVFFRQLSVGKLQTRTLRLVLFGLVWYLVFPLPILFNKPFAAYSFVGAIPGVCFVAASLGSLFLDRLNTSRGRAITLAVFTSLTVAGALVTAQVDLGKPASITQSTALARQVLDDFHQDDIDFTKYEVIYLVGFPYPLFNLGSSGSFTRDVLDYKALAAFDIFLGYPADVVQVPTLEALPEETCHSALVYTYRAYPSIQEMRLPLDCQTD